MATHAQAIHPGYGFLSENAGFAGLCKQHGVVFIGPSAEIIAKWATRRRRRLMRQTTCPPPRHRHLKDAQEAVAAAEKIGYPVLIKASAGGGGKGMREVHDPADLAAQYKAARTEAGAAFGNDGVYLEKLVLRPRHVEVQVLADDHGNAVALCERDCSIQRRHQKLLEEAPSPALSENLRRDMMKAALKAVRAVDYRNAGTIEFLLDDKLNYYFMEMNTRIQVEHPVTEMVTGTDLVEEMIRVAAGDPLTFTQDDITYRGHAIECRVNAEQPERGFLPSPGTISQMHLPGGNGVRVDTAAYDGYEITPYYDSMIAKVIVHGRDRTEAIAKMRTALEEMVVVGVKTNLDFQYAIMENETFAAGHADTSFIERFMKGEV